MFPTSLVNASTGCVSFALWVLCLACSERAQLGPISDPSGETGADGGAAGAASEVAAGAAGTPDSSYAGNGAESECRPGQTRCHGSLGFQRCTPEAVWGKSQSCGGYSENGTSSYCITEETEDGPWALCVDPACWWWRDSGLGHEGLVAGACSGDSQIRPCNAGGILLAARACDGACRVVAQLDGRALGYCEASCVDGERECLAGPLYRECRAGVWSSETMACADGETCQALAGSESLEIRCGGACEAGTSRCSADGSTVEGCDELGQWQAAAAPCSLGRCVRSGAQAQCQTECRPGEYACAFDGADSERRCGEQGLWGETIACSEGERCRLGVRGSLGCLSCVGVDQPGGNAWGVADSWCEAGGVVECGSVEPVACASGDCVELARSAGTLAYCK